MSRGSESGLRGRRAPLAMPAEEFRAAGHGLVDAIADFLESLPRRPVNRDEGPSEIRAALPQGAVPQAGADAPALLDQTARLLFEHSLFNGHPRFLGYITSSAAPIGALADLLAAAVNPNLGGWKLSPVASEIELQTVRWIAELIGYPAQCGGLFVSGGNVANFVCFLAARRARGEANLREDGLAAARGRMLVYATEQVHTWIHKAADLFGHGTSAIRTIPVDRELRADVSELEQRIAADRQRGDVPFLVVASAGTVSTGAIDPIRDMAEVARRQGLWFHVDGAYGALAAVLEDASPDLAALSQADSVAVDPHKWLYAPLEAGCALLRDPKALPAAFGYRPPYYHFDDTDDPELNFYEHGMQNSRGFRALKVWLSLRQVGRSGFVRMIGDDVALAREAFRILDAHPEIEAKTLGLSIVTFRYRPAAAWGEPRDKAYLDELNQALLSRLMRSGELFVSNAIVDGAFLLRLCVVNFRTSLEDIEALPEIVLRHGRWLQRRMRPPQPG